MWNNAAPQLPSSLENKLVIKRSKRAKRVALRLDTKARVINLVVPKGVSMKRAYRFAYDNRDWISDTLKSLPEPVKFVQGADIPVLGQTRRIEMIQEPGRRITSIDMEPNALIVRTNLHDPSARIARFLKERARDELGALARQKAERINKRIAGLQVRDTKSRWGSCSEDGRISLSWRLIFAPTAAYDYVVAHEVAHLRHLNHSKSFWALCRSLSDNYLEGHHWMRNHGHELMRYG